MIITLKKTHILAAMLSIGILAATQGANAATCSYEVTNEWKSGLNGEIKIANTGKTAINGWTVNWRYAKNRMAGSWRANITGSNPYKAQNLDWNGSIQPGETVSFGVKVDKNGGVAEIPTITGSICSNGIKTPPQTALYTQKGTDPTWAEVLATDSLRPLYRFTDKGVLGSTISINRALIETGEYGNRPINSAKNNYSLHAVGNPAIPQDKFDRWSRWYQEDGNTQIFRLFKDEENVSNSRALAARVEISSPDDRWLPQPGVWREFSARFTVVKAKGCSALPVKSHYCSIFQAKGNNVDHWSVMLRVHGDGSLWFYPRENINKGKIKIRDNVVGKPFDMKVRDNGLNYEMWIDGVSVGSGKWPRTLEIGFRWGIYVGDTQVVDDVMVLVTGAKMK